MNLFGLTIARTKALQLQAVSSRGGGWWPLISEAFTGAWQSNIEVNLTDVLSHPTVFACISLISADIAKNPVKLVRETTDGIWEEAESPAFSPVLRKPNHYQTRIGFYESWIISKLIHGNTYVLKQRDERNIVTGLYVLDPQRVKPLVARDGAVYYELMRDDLSHLPDESIIVPAKEIIHDIYTWLYHPLIGVSPIYACGIAAIQGLRIQSNQTNMFVNGAVPRGILTAPGFVKQDVLDRVKAYWDTNFTGANAGKVAVLGDNLKYESIGMTAVDSDLIKQLDWADKKICSTFHVPGWMVGVGDQPQYNNIESIWRLYYGQCLQVLFEKIENHLDEGIGLTAAGYGSEFDLKNLLRMDSQSLMSTLKEGVSAGIIAPDEARFELNLKPVPGGKSPMAQQQNFSLEALAERDRNKPFAKPDTGTQPTVAQPILPEDKSVDIEAELGDLLRKELELTAA